MSLVLLFHYLLLNMFRMLVLYIHLQELATCCDDTMIGLNAINIYQFITHSYLYFIENILLTELNLREYNVLSAFREVFVKIKRDTNADNGANKPKT